MDILKHAASQSADPAALLSAIPFCRHLGLTAKGEGTAFTIVMPFAPHLIGNPVLPALHGGVIGAFLETAAVAQVVWELGGAHLPKPVDITIDYLRSGRAVETYARAHIAKRGRRVVNVHAEAWQEDEAKPIASLRGHFLLSASDRAPA